MRHIHTLHAACAEGTAVAQAAEGLHSDADPGLF